MVLVRGWPGWLGCGMLVFVMLPPPPSPPPPHNRVHVISPPTCPTPGRNCCPWGEGGQVCVCVCDLWPVGVGGWASGCELVRENKGKGFMGEPHCMCMCVGGVMRRRGVQLTLTPNPNIIIIIKGHSLRRACLQTRIYNMPMPVR